MEEHVQILADVKHANCLTPACSKMYSWVFKLYVFPEGRFLCVNHPSSAFSFFLSFFQTALQGETVHFHQQSWESKVALCCLWADTQLTRTPALTVVLLAQKGTTERPPKSSDVVLRVWSHSSNICECSLKLNIHSIYVYSIKYPSMNAGEKKKQHNLCHAI